MGALARMRRVSLDPKNLITFLITLVLVVGESRYGIVGGYGKLATTLGTAVGTELLLSLFLLGRRPGLQSAYVTGISLTMLLRPQAGLDWPFVVGPFLAIASKYVLRYRGRHVWNPSNLAIAALVLLAPHRIAVLSHEFGNDLAGNAVIWFFGILIAARARILHVTATYVLCFVALAVPRALWTGTPLAAEIGPLTGPMYQLMIFFMLTDPRTSVSTRRGRMLTVAVIALVEAAMRLGNDFHVPGAAIFAPAPPILALSLVGPAAMVLDLRRAARRAPIPTIPACPGPSAPSPIGGKALVKAGERTT